MKDEQAVSTESGKSIEVKRAEVIAIKNGQVIKYPPMVMKTSVVGIPFKKNGITLFSFSHTLESDFWNKTKTLFGNEYKDTELPSYIALTANHDNDDIYSQISRNMMIGSKQGQNKEIIVMPFIKGKAFPFIIKSDNRGYRL